MKRIEDFLKQHERAIAMTVMGAFVVLAVLFSSGPIFEGPDEQEHYRYIRYLAENAELPDPGGQYRGQYHQAPLYYLLLTPVKLALPDADFALTDARYNPFYPNLIFYPGNDNKNYFLHSASEQFPYRSQTAFAVHYLRLFSVVLGLGTLALIRASSRLLWHGSVELRLAMLSMAAFWPQFVFISSVLNNDSLLIFLSTAALYLLLRMRTLGPTRPMSILMGVALGAALLTKVSALFLVFPVGVAVIIDKRLWRPAVLILVITLLVGGWWYARNWLLGSDVTNVSASLVTWADEAITGVDPVQVRADRAPYAYQSLWVRFGTGAVGGYGWQYRLFDGLVLLGVAGAVVAGVHRRLNRWRLWVPVVVMGFAWFAALIYFSGVAWSGNQGRYLLPALAAWSVLLTIWVSVLPRQSQAIGTSILSLGLLGHALFSLVGVFLPAYQPGAYVETEGPTYRIDDMAVLHSPLTAPLVASPGEIVEMTLYWEAVGIPGEGTLAYLSLIENETLRRNTHPGTGHLLASDWQPGMTWSERYDLLVPADMERQRVYTMLAGLHNPDAGITYPALDAAGNEVTPVVGQLIVPGDSVPADPEYQFGESIGLRVDGVSQDDDTLTVCLTWYVLGRVNVGYSVFLHALDQAGQPITQYDGQPKGGAYPTWAWQPGEAIKDCLVLTSVPVKPGWSLALGLYNPADVVRLPVLRLSDNQPLPNDMILIAR